MRQTCIFSGSSHPELVHAICERLGQKVSDVTLAKFSNGETRVEINSSVRDQDVFIVQSGSSKINDNVMEMLIMISACKGGSSRSITAVLPYFPYSRQSKKKSHRGAITARMIANLMNVAGVNHVITIDLHASQMQGFFKCPVDNLVAEPILAKWIKANEAEWQDAVVVSKNPGGTKRVTSLADSLKVSFGIVTTDRRRFNATNSMADSAVFESMGTDGTNEQRQLEEEEAEAQTFTTRPQSVAPVQPDFGPCPTTNGDIPYRPANRHRVASLRSRLVNGYNDPPSSPLAQSTRPDSVEASPHRSSGSPSNPHRIRTALGTTQPPSDEDGYEEPANPEFNDERAQDVITGRLIHGHIVDDDHPSPALSAMSNSIHYGHRHNSDDELPDNLLSSFISTTSSHRNYHEHGLGGTADATASDEEEEQALQNPELETTITLVGNVKDRPVFIVDDMIDKAGSWIAAAEAVVKRGGATKVYCMATHGLFGGDSLRELEACDQVDRIIVTNAFPIPEEKRRGVKKLVVLDVSNLLAEAIRRNHHGESISQLYQHFD